jgi:hypothetical protein
VVDLHALKAMTSQKYSLPRAVGERVVASPDGLLTFALMRSASGVHVERRSIVNGSSLSLAVLFRNAAQFDRFRDSDRSRYDYPQTFKQLELAFDELLICPRCA